MNCNDLSRRLCRVVISNNNLKREFPVCLLANQPAQQLAKPQGTLVSGHTNANVGSGVHVSIKCLCINSLPMRL